MIKEFIVRIEGSEENFKNINMDTIYQLLGGLREDFDENIKISRRECSLAIER